MGKATKKRIEWRKKYFTELAKTNPGKCQEEINIRLESWSQEIWKVANQDKINTVRVFDIALRASGCGLGAKKILENEACKALRVNDRKTTRALRQD